MNVSEVVQVDPEILGGTPVFTGTRVPITVLFENLADGLSLVEILDSYPTIKREQAIEALRIAQDRLIAHYSRLRLADLLTENAKEPPADLPEWDDMPPVGKEIDR